MIGPLHRIGSLTALAAASLFYYVFKDPGYAAQVEASPAASALGAALSHVWPPSQKSMAFWLTVAVIFAVGILNFFFSGTEAEEDKRVRVQKKRLILAQMVQALKWNKEDEEEESCSEGEEKDEDKDKDKDKDKEKKRPPPAKDLYEMLYDDVEDRHVTEYGIEAGEFPYKQVLALFKERVAADLRDAVRYTKLARSAMDGGAGDLDRDDLKFCAHFVDGTNLSELLELCTEKIRKKFGREYAPQDLIRAAKETKRELAMAQRKGFMTLVPLIQPLLPWYGVAILLMIFDSSFGALTWHSMSTILDGVDAGTMTLAELRTICFSSYAILIFCVFSHLTSRAIVSKVTSRFRLGVRSEVMRCMVRQDMAFFDIFPSGLLQERLNNDAESLASKLFDIPMNIIHMTFILLSNAVVVFMMKRELFIAVFLPIPPVSVATYFIMKFMDKLQERQRRIAEHAAAGTLEVLKEIRTVREFAMEVEEADHFYANSSYRAGIEEWSEAINNIVFISPLVCLFIGSRLGSTYIAGGFVAQKAMTVGQAIQVGFIGEMLQHVVRELMFLMPEVVKVLNPLGRICDMLASEPKIEPHPSSPEKFEPESYRGHIVFEDVDFTFPSEPQKQILFRLSFEVKPGEKVAFVGTTGCGKSTSIKLIERFYEPTAGTIYLDGRNIQDYDVYHLRRNMSVVAQDNMLFSTTLRENIVYGLPREQRERISDAEVEAACRKANAWTFVNEFPRKLETYAGERGVKLSGGQKQRLAIARAIIRRPSIVLLDEATSALDSKSEGVVQEALDKMIGENKNGCTIMIAHRLATVKRCDRIIVMDKGQIKEQNCHDELLKIPIKKAADGKMLTGWYHDLWATQMGGDDGQAQKIEHLERRVRMLEEENARLLRDPLLGYKLGKFKREDKENRAGPPPLKLVRARSSTAEVQEEKPEVVPPFAPVHLERARTTVQ